MTKARSSLWKLPRLFQRPGVDTPDAFAYPDLVHAAEHGQVLRVLCLLLLGADIEAVEPHFHNTALLRAAYFGNCSTVRLLLRFGADVMATDLSGYDSLMWAAYSGDMASVEALLTDGSDAGRMTVQGDTALKLAVRKTYANRLYFPIVKLLLESGADIHACGPGGGTVLQDAVHDGSVETLVLLLEHGADLEAKMNGGRTFLMIASEGLNEPTVRFLLDHGADVHAKDDEGNGVLEYVEDGYLDAYYSPFASEGETEKVHEKVRATLLAAGAVDREENE